MAEFDNRNQGRQDAATAVRLAGLLPNPHDNSRRVPLVVQADRTRFRNHAAKRFRQRWAQFGQDLQIEVHPVESGH
jgi:hypothetical protein